MDVYYHLPEFIYQVVGAIESGNVEKNSPLIALSIIVDSYANMNITTNKIVNIDEKRLSIVLDKLKNDMKLYDEIYRGLEEFQSIMPLVKFIYKTAKICINPVNMYNFINRSFHPLKNELHLKDISKYEFDKNHSHLTIYQVNELATCNIMEMKHDGLYIITVKTIEETSPIIDLLISKINTLNNVNSDAHHC